MRMKFLLTFCSVAARLIRNPMKPEYAKNGIFRMSAFIKLVAIIVVFMMVFFPNKNLDPYRELCIVSWGIYIAANHIFCIFFLGSFVTLTLFIPFVYLGFVFLKKDLGVFYAIAGGYPLGFLFATIFRLTNRISLALTILAFCGGVFILTINNKKLATDVCMSAIIGISAVTFLGLLRIPIFFGIARAHGLIGWSMYALALLVWFVGTCGTFAKLEYSDTIQKKLGTKEEAEPEAEKK